MEPNPYQSPSAEPNVTVVVRPMRWQERLAHSMAWAMLSIFSLSYYKVWDVPVTSPPMPLHVKIRNGVSLTLALVFLAFAVLHLAAGVRALLRGRY